MGVSPGLSCRFTGTTISGDYSIGERAFAGGSMALPPLTEFKGEFLFI